MTPAVKDNMGVLICGESVITSNSPLSYTSPSREVRLGMPPDAISPKGCNILVSKWFLSWSV
jgi:hypothetical protein